MPDITREEVAHLADLARIDLSDAELDHLAPQLAVILDSIKSITDQAARDRLVADYDHDLTSHEWATGYRWDVVLTGSHATPLEREDDDDA